MMCDGGGQVAINACPDTKGSGSFWDRTHMSCVWAIHGRSRLLAPVESAVLGAVSLCSWVS